MRVLFVCLGNICRSPTAEAVFSKMSQAIDLPISCDSAGTSSYHSNSPADERASLAAKKRGYDLNTIRSRQIEAQDFYEFDYILAMDQANYHDILDISPDNKTAKVEMLLDYHSQPGQDRNVPDPYWSGAHGFELVLDLIEDACENFLKQKAAK